MASNNNSKGDRLNQEYIFGGKAMALLILIAVLGLGCLIYVALPPSSTVHVIVIGGLMIVLFIIIALVIKNQLIKPLVSIRIWSDRVRGGNWSAKMPAFEGKEVGQLARDLEGIGSLIETLSNKMDVEVAVQTEQLAQKTEALFVAEERARVAAELHDSLAQTLASLRFQVRAVDEMMQQDNESSTQEELKKLESQVELANQELRALIGQFRAPIVAEQIVPAVEQLVNNFRADSDVSVFFQNEWQPDDLSAEQRIDLIRIVQEALANIKKHANAKTVRVLIRHNNNRYRIMIEDDGIGYDESRIHHGDDGDHIGLQIMQQRADHLGAQLRLESDPGEGSLISLELDSKSITEAKSQ